MAAALRFLLAILVLHPGSVKSLSGRPGNATTEQNLPNVSFQADPLYQEMESKLTSLQNRMRASQDQEMASLRQQKQAYEKILQADQAQNDNLRDANEKLAVHINSIRAKNQQLREESQELIHANKKLSIEIERFQSNLSLAQEFAALSLKKGEMDFSTPELRVLSELVEHDDEVARNERHHQMLNEIDQSGSKMSAVQLKSAILGSKTNDSQRWNESMSLSVDRIASQRMVLSLSSSLEELSKHQKLSKQMLGNLFSDRHKMLQDAIANLVEEQTSLNRSVFSLFFLQERLRVARNLLQDINRDLHRRSDGLEAFARKLGQQHISLSRLDPTRETKSNNNNSKNITVSLLQSNQKVKIGSYLPDLPEILVKPRETYNALNTHVGTLLSRLQNKHAQHVNEISKQKVALEQKLAKQDMENVGLEQAIGALKDDIAMTQRRNEGLRNQSTSLLKENNVLRMTLNNLMLNMSFADEFVGGALSDVERMFHNSSDLRVLAELDAKDAAHAAEVEHSSRLNLIAGASEASMLVQVMAHLRPRQMAQDLLQQMDSAIHEFSKEQNASMASLQEQFDEKFHQGELWHQSLLGNLSRLNATKAKEMELQQRLEKALDHLKGVREQLSAQINSIQGFLRALSKKGLPVQEENKGNNSNKIGHVNPEPIATDIAKSRSQTSLLQEQESVKQQDQSEISHSRVKAAPLGRHSMTRGHQKLTEARNKQKSKGSKEVLAGDDKNVSKKAKTHKRIHDSSKKHDSHVRKHKNETGVSKEGSESNCHASWFNWLPCVVKHALTNSGGLNPSGF